MQKNIILFIASLAMFMEAVDTTVINTAIPAMSQSLHVNPIDLKLALISYLLSLSIFIPISGWIADKFGVKKVFIIAIIVFTLSSIWCGFTTNLNELIIARFIQGLGGSLTLPIGRLIIVRTCEKHELIVKMNAVVMVASLGLMLGPVVGGLITHYFSWRWIFWVNVPIGLLAVVLSMTLLPEMGKRPVHVLDKIGFFLFGIGLAMLTYSLSTFSETDGDTSHSLVMMMVAFVLLISYAIYSQNKTHPIVNVNLLRIRTFRISVLGNLLSRLGFGGVPFLLPLLLQIGLKLPAQVSGLLMAPVAIGVIIVKPVSLTFLRLLGYRRLLILNTVLVGCSLSAFATIGLSVSFYYIIMLTFIYGFLVALQYTGMNSLAYANISYDEVSAATSIMSTTQQIAQSFGVAFAAILVRVYESSFSSFDTLSLATMHKTFFTLGALTILSILIFLGLKKFDGQEMIGRKK